MINIDYITTGQDIISLPISQGRVLSASQTFRNIYKLKHKIGVTRLNYISEFHNLGIPVFSVTRPNVHPSHRNCSTQGKGLRIIDAAVSALMEAYEHQAANDYKSISTFSIQKLALLNLPFLDPRTLGYLYKEDDLVDWIEGYSMFDNVQLYLPVIASLFPYVPTKKAVIPFQAYSSTTGLASGNTKLEALLYACFELFEREGRSEFVSGNKFRVLREEEILQYTRLLKVFERFKQTQMQFCILQLYSRLNLPIISVSIISSNPVAPPVVVTGHSCRLTLEEALISAFTEVVQIYNTVMQSSREDLIRNNNLWKYSYDEIFENWFESKKVLTSLSQPIEYREYLRDSSILERIKIVCTHLQQAGFNQAYFADLTNNEVQVPVIRTLIPGLRDLAHDSLHQKPNLFYLKDWFMGI